MLSHQSRRRAFILFHAPGALASLLANSEKRLKEAAREEKKLRMTENLDQRPRPTIVTPAFTPRIIDVAALLSYLLISSYLVDQNHDYCDICYSTNSTRIGR